MNPLLFYLSTVLTAATAFTSTPSVHSNGFQYGIQMDAGSSGTRLYVYKWTLNSSPSTPSVFCSESAGMFCDVAPNKGGGQCSKSAETWFIKAALDSPFKTCNQSNIIAMFFCFCTFAICGCRIDC